MHTSPLVTLTLCIVGRSRAHSVVIEEKAPRRPSWLCGGGVGAGQGGAGGRGGSTSSSQCWSVSKGVRISLLPNMESIAIAIWGRGGVVSLTRPIVRGGEVGRTGWLTYLIAPGGD
jgi:hypothetical protein